VSRYAAGVEAERKTMAVLEAAGYQTARMAGSHGMFDVIAWDRQRFRLIQVKRGVARLSPADREAMQNAAVPENASREYWRWPLRARQPLIEVIQ
jgi:predicted transcriptional regulator